MRGLLYRVGVLLLALLAWLGLSSGISQLGDGVSMGQHVQTASQFGYGISALMVLVTSFTVTRWRRGAQLAFVLCCAMAGGLAPVVWGGDDILSGLGAAAGASLVAAACLWMLRGGRTAAMPDEDGPHTGQPS